MRYLRIVVMTSLKMTIAALSTVAALGSPAPALAGGSDTLAAASFPDSARHESRLSIPYNGWTYLVERLRLEGVSQDSINAIYNDSRMPKHENIPFKIRPREHAADYQGFYAKSRIEKARNYLAENDSTFKLMHEAYPVNPKVIAALHLVETDVGNYLGDSLVINRLSRLSSLNEANNTLWNFAELRRAGEKPTLRQVRGRADYLDRVFFPEVIAFIDYTQREGVDPFSIKGSVAGAFGIPQFLPRSLLQYGRDGNGDGKVDLFNRADAIFSTANYLVSNGWRENMSRAEKVRVLLRYNQSVPYAHAVLKVAEML